MLLANFIDLFLDSAPWLLLGLVLAGMLKMFVPMAWMHKQLGGHGFKSTVKAALLGAPLPLCSCGVIPAAVGLRRSGASKAATTSFLVSTPETGVDSIAISYVLLGPFMAIIRPIAAVISAITAGLLVGRDDQLQEIKNQAADHSYAHNSEQPAQSSCCSKKESSSTCSGGSDKQHNHKHSHEADIDCCESTKDIAQELQGTPIHTRIVKGLHFAATDLIRDTTVWLLIGLFFAAVVQTYVPADFMAKWGDGILAMLVMVIISIPMYICATASTPIAAGLLLAGVSPGAVLVFMLAGPATNIATLGVVAKELGKRALLGYLGGVLGVALLSGVVVNYLVNTFGFVVMPQIGEQSALLPEALVYSSGIILALLMAKVFFDMLPLKRARKDCCS
ncbi:SO_0444 family Cu/Zn efflux transporter [Psychromonas ossibalaenae]|uniref:SO_0444 family Cu/Zn efflux transporter n=1 Tax=Psychromonas ossibalaenae TaxID=444922 RepID=UPI000375E00E|nr:SO_0444 family Cu/Zn efflux transporter [Psychromonas ossibalaenae]